MSFRSVFIAVVIAFGLIVAAFLINRARPRVETSSNAGARSSALDALVSAAWLAR